ncbi:hypothetical protein EON77_22195, partial [bacterium]
MARCGIGRNVRRPGVGALRIRAAVAAWRIRPIRSDARFFGHIYDLVSAAHDEGAQLLVLPELFCLELLGLEPRLDEAKAPRYLAQYAAPIEEWMSRIAKNSGLVIVGGSHFRERDGKIVNAAPIALPDGQVLFQEKNNLTEYERVEWKLDRGEGLQALPDPLGVLVCYDSEFPEAVRRHTENGARLLAVPSWTETQRGFQRVRWSVLARALENQIFAIHASLVGDLGGEPVPTTFGSSAIIAPSIEPFPVEAILRETPLGEEGVVVADLDFDLLEAARVTA